MSRKLETPVQDIEAVKWNGNQLSMDAAPAWLRKAATVGKEPGGVWQSYSDLWVYADDGIAIANPHDFLVYFHEFNIIVPMRQRAFFAMMGGPVHEL